MAMQRVNPTRMELLKLKKRAILAQKGHKLLKEKRDGLMQEFLALIREVKEKRIIVDDQLGIALRHFMMAQAAMDSQAVTLVSKLKLQEITALGEIRNVMGVRIPEFAITQKESGAQYPWWETSPELDVALEKFQAVLPLLLELATKEKSAQLLAQEIEKTRRRVNALEHVLIPQLKTTAKFIRMKLEEQARAAIVTTMKVKQSIT
jgi:V/A-type H+/Na+-transporting ATPase subunit D